MTGGSSTNGKGCLTGVLGLLGVIAFVATMMTTIIGVAIWPGEMKLVAPLVCPSDQPDAFVVSDTYKPTPGETTTNFTLYCVGERGDFTEAGMFEPLLLLTVLHALILLAIVALFAIPRILARRFAPAAADSTAPASAMATPGPAEKPVPQSPIVSGAIDDDPGSNLKL